MSIEIKRAPADKTYCEECGDIAPGMGPMMQFDSCEECGCGWNLDSTYFVCLMCIIKKATEGISVK